MVLVDVTGIKQNLDAPRHGPYETTETFTNGTVRIQRGIVNDRISIRCITPFTERYQFGGKCCMLKNKELKITNNL
jgi:hypothetical protein